MNAIRFVFAANVLVAGAVGLSSLLGGAGALRTVWQAPLDPASQPVRVVGAFWTAIAVLSLGGLFFPRAFAAVLLVQLIYKASWLAVIALPALLGSRAAQVPSGIATFFAVWVVVLPFVIPWRDLFART